LGVGIASTDREGLMTPRNVPGKGSVIATLLLAVALLTGGAAAATAADAGASLPERPRTNRSLLRKARRLGL
jgi:hypothetical protein